jgi:GT2 family glycosyltransferase
MELRADYLEKAIHFLDDLPGVAAITGQILKDGGIEREEARSLIAGYQPVEEYSGLFIRDVKHAILYGCCMTIRRSLLNYEKFDENLPLYSFGEDYDISMRLRRYGLIGKYQKCIAVHLKTQGGRVNEVQRGYSIVANNWYFLRKGIVHLPRPLALARFWLIVVAKLLIEALWKSMQRKQDTDWLRRAEGFVLAVVDIVRGRSAPQRVVDFSQRP